MSLIKCTGRVLYAAFFILIGFNTLTNFPNGTSRIVAAFANHYKLMREKLPILEFLFIDMEFINKHADFAKQAVGVGLIAFGALSCYGNKLAYFMLTLALFFYVDIVYTPLAIRSNEEFLESFKNWALECALFGFSLIM